MHLVYPPEFCITIVSNFSWVLQSFQEKSKTMVKQNLGGVNKVHYGLCENGELYFGCQWFMQAVYFFFKLFQINRSTCKNLREKFLQAGLAVEMSAACLHRIS